MMTPKFYAQSILFIAMTVPACIVCAAIHPLQDIRDTAIRLARSHFSANGNGADIKISAGQLDSRLRLPQCKSPLQAYFPHTTGSMTNTTVGVRCNSARPWSIYVPISIQVYRQVAIAGHTMAQHKVLTREDFSMQRRDISKFSGAYIATAEQLIGKQLKRPVQIGRPLLANMLKEPIAIRRGEKVTLLAKRGTFEVRVEGKALMNAAVGDKIRVQNLRSNRIIEGRLADSGLVYVN